MRLPPVSRDGRRLILRPVLAVLAMMLLVGAGASVASATFGSTTGGSTSVTTGTLAPPTKLAATASCTKLTVVLTWTASASTYTDGYELRYTAAGVARVLVLPGRSTTTTTVALSKGVTYVFTLASTSPSSWSSITNPTAPTVRC
jgi:hypothetical protein